MSDTTQHSIATPHPSGPDRSSALSLDETFEEMAPGEDHEPDLDYEEGFAGAGSVSPETSVDLSHAEEKVQPDVQPGDQPATQADTTPGPVGPEQDRGTSHHNAGTDSPHMVSSASPPESFSEARVLSENSTPEEPTLIGESVTQSATDTAQQAPLDPGIGVLTENTAPAAEVAEIESSLPQPQEWVWRSPDVVAERSGVMPPRSALDPEASILGDASLESEEPSSPSAPTEELGTFPASGSTEEQHPAPDQITLPFYVHGANGEVTADYVAYRRDAGGFYEIDPSDMERNEVKGYLQKGLISGRLASRSLDGRITPVEAGTQSASDFMAQQADYYACNEDERKVRPWPVLDPETTSQSPGVSTPPQPEATSAPVGGPATHQFDTVQVRKPAIRKPKTEGERFLGVLDLTLAAHRTAEIKGITASERARFLDIRHTPRKEISRRAGTKIGMLGRVRMAAAAALRNPSKADPKTLSERAITLGSQTTRDIGNVRHISAAVTPSLRNAVLSYESTSETLSKGIQSLNVTVTQHPDFPKLAEAVSECMTALSTRGGPRITAEMVMAAANDSSLSLPALEKVRDRAKAILESNPDLMLISTSTNLLAQKLARHSREIGNAIIGLKQSGLPEGHLKQIEEALGRFHLSTADIGPCITPNSGTNLLRETISYMRDMSAPASLEQRPEAHSRSPEPLEHHIDHDVSAEQATHPEP